MPTRIVDDTKIEEQVITLLREVDGPVSIEFVRNNLNLTWTTTRALLLSMAQEGKILGVKTSTSWIFWLA